jgi:TolA-binding protein
MKIIVSVIILSFLLITVSPPQLFGKEAGKVYYRIHEASYKKPGTAAAEVKALHAKGYKAYYKKVHVPGKGTWYRVYIGRYDSHESAEKAAREMKHKHTIDYAAIERSDGSVARKGPVPAKDDRKEAKTVSDAVRRQKKDEKKRFARRDGRDAEKRAGKGSAAAPAVTAVKEKDAGAAKSQAETAVPPSVTKAYPVPPVEPATSDPLFNKAMEDFRAGRYDSALDALKKLYSRKPADPVIREKVIRRLADTHYFLGEKNGKQDYFNAVDYYKEVLNTYPDVREGNDQVYFRMAKSYEYLKFFYEAFQALEKLGARYPDSPYAADAMFMAADIYNRLGKLKEASEKGLLYLKKYPDGAHAKNAHFIVADCFYRLNQPANADIWYGQALKKWPDLSDVPKFMLMDLGYHYYRSRKFSEASDIFSYYISLYPDNEWAKMAMLAMGRSLAEMNRTTLALKVFSRVVEKYPESNEAREAAILMADIGVEKPGLRIPAFMAASENYREPITAYDNMLAKNPEGDISEQLLAFKGRALSKAGRYREAFDTYSRYLKQYPRGKYLDEVVRNYKLIAGQLIGTYYNKGDHVAVADLYYAASIHGLVSSIDFDTLFKVGDSLKMIGLYDDAALVFNEMTKLASSTQNENRAILAMAEVDVLRGKNKEAEQKLQSILNQTKTKDMQALQKAKTMMADVAFHQGLYDRAVQSYRDILNATKSHEDVLSLYDRYAGALKEKDMCTLAIRYYLKIIEAASKDEKRYSPKYLADSYLGLGDCYFAEKRFKEGMAMYQQAMALNPEQGQKMWQIYRIGQEYWRSENFPEADKAFGLLKSSPEGPFWSKVIEYQTESGKWSDKYARYLK